MKTSAVKTMEQAQTSDRKSFEPKKADLSMALKGSKEATSSSLEQPPKKKPKQSDSQTPPGNFLTLPFIQVEPISFAYPFDLPDPSTEDQLTITKLFTRSKTPPPTIIDTSVNIL